MKNWSLAAAAQIFPFPLAQNRVKGVTSTLNLELGFISFQKSLGQIKVKHLLKLLFICKEPCVHTT